MNIWNFAGNALFVLLDEQKVDLNSGQDGHEWVGSSVQLKTEWMNMQLGT